MAGRVIVVDHPVVQHKLTQMRRRETPSGDFRRLLREISTLFAYEVTRDLPVTTVEIETPVAQMMAPVLADRSMCFVSILRAGNGIVDGMLDVLPNARVGHIGLYRDPNTLMPIEYYLKLPQDITERRVIVVDPMLATGNSAAGAVHRLKDHGVTTIKVVCLLASPEGIANFHEQHPDIDLYTAAIDQKLDEHGYIIPGLGDAGDRLFGTK